MEAVEGTVSHVFISSIRAFDDVTGAPEWSTRHVAVVSAIILGGVQMVMKQKFGVNWYSFLHAIVTGLGSFVCVWLDVFAAVPMTGVSQPLGAVLCQGPLTSLHTIIPAMTMGFGVFDIIEGFRHGTWDFVSCTPPMVESSGSISCSVQPELWN